MTNVLTQLIAKISPVLGAILPIPGGSVIGQAIAAAFGANNIGDPSLVAAIQNSPDALVKLKQIESDNQIQIQKILTDYATAQLQKEQNDVDREVQDRMDARVHHKENSLDNIIKGYLVFALSFIIFICLYIIAVGNIQGEENNIVMMVLGSSFTALTSIVFYYWGTSFSTDKNLRMKK